MTVHHEEITKFLPEELDDDKRIVTNIDLFNNILLESRDSQVLLISIVGPYQTGKSSLIKLLTQDREIAHGNGTNEQTNGATIYGPYLYNEIRSRFRLPRVDKELLLYFIDTEGICGFRLNGSPTMNRLLLTQILSPYVALSQIALVMHRSNIESFAASFIQEFFDKVMQYCGNDNEIELITICPSQPFKLVDHNGTRIEISDQYKNACSVLRQEMPKKFNGFKTSKYIALYNFIEADGPLHQLSTFYERFHFAALDIIESIEKARTSHIYDGKAIVDQFQKINESFKSENFVAILEQARKEAQFNTVERIYLPSIKRIVETKKNEISSLYPKVDLSSSEDDRLRTKTISIEKIADSVEVELSKFNIPEKIRDEVNAKFMKYIIDELRPTYEALNNEYLQQLHLRQGEYLLSKVIGAINNIEAEATVGLLASEKTAIESKKLQGYIDLINLEINKAIEDACKKYNILEITKDVVMKSVENNKKEVKNSLIELAKSVAERNETREAERKAKRSEEIKYFFKKIATGIADLVKTGLTAAGPDIAASILKEF